MSSDFNDFSRNLSDSFELFRFLSDSLGFFVFSRILLYSIGLTLILSDFSRIFDGILQILSDFLQFSQFFWIVFVSFRIHQYSFRFSRMFVSSFLELEWFSRILSDSFDVSQILLGFVSRFLPYSRGFLRILSDFYRIFHIFRKNI